MTKTHPNLIKLRPYQEEDCARIMRYKAFACFNEQRTGKTPTALQSLVRRNVTKILVVCPKSAIYPWVQEAERWTGLPAVACVGTKQKRDAIIHLLWLAEDDESERRCGSSNIKKHTRRCYIR